ncbi:protein of unknown function [Methylocella tundrae]|uniref:Uncharacterized protein n=1 Tax=Methylocella tundrae TaxID=227605 RepID=A0A4U8Z0H2_METTU|nr:protein of unknown function [Methylocella tundrae]
MSQIPVVSPSPCADGGRPESARVPAMAGQFARSSARAFHGAGSASRLSAALRLRPPTSRKNSPMRASRIDLKLRLALRVAALAAFCFAAAAAYVLFETDRAAQARANWIAEVLAKDLALQQGQLHWIKGAPSQFPDLQRIAPALMGLGVCVAYRARDGEMIQRLCSGVAPGDAGPQLSPTSTSACLARTGSRRVPSSTTARRRGRLWRPLIARASSDRAGMRRAASSGSSPSRCLRCASLSTLRSPTPCGRPGRSAPGFSASPPAISRRVCRPSTSPSFRRSATSSIISPAALRRRSPSATR